MVNLYISKEYEEFYDQLKVVADGNSYAGEIGKAVKQYIQKLNNEVEIIDTNAFEKLLKTGSKEELIIFSTLICEYNNKIIQQCQK